jgi:hypothetical protein
MAFRAGAVRFSISNDYVAHRVAVAPRQWQWTEFVAVPIAAMSMVMLTLALAAEPWIRACNPAAVRPIAVAALLLLIAADLLFAPRREWSRSRNNATMNTICLASLIIVIVCVAGAGSFDWPVLYPLLVFPLSLVLAPPIALGFASRLPLGADIRRWAIISCLALATALALLGLNAYQAHIACRWPGV